MKRALIILTIGLFSCGQALYKKPSEDLNQEKGSTTTSDLTSIGVKIHGDFNGDEKTDVATVKKTKEGIGNPGEDGTPDEYEVQFSSGIKSINADCCAIRLINEGDLNNDGSDEISIVKAPINGCTYSMTTYSFVNGTWKQFIETFLIPTGCDELSDEDYQNRIFSEKNTVYFLDTDPNDENQKLVKKKANTK